MVSEFKGTLGCQLILSLSPSPAHRRSISLTSILTVAALLLAQVMYAQLPAVSFQHLKRDIDLYSAYYTAITEDHDGFIWFGSASGGGLYRYDGYTLRSFLPDPTNMKTSIPGTRIFKTYLGVDDRLYVATNFGFSVVDPVTGQIESFNNRYDLAPDASFGWTRCFLQDTVHRTLWIGTAYGLARMNAEAGDSIQLLRPSTPVDQHYMPGDIICLVKHPRNTGLLWLGTTEGVFQYDIDADQYTHIRCTDIPAQEKYIRDMYVDKSGMIWISQGDGYVAGYNPDTQQWIVHRIPANQHLPASSRGVNRLIPAGGNEAWVAVETSVGKINLSNGHFENWEYSADRPDGLLPNYVFLDLLNDRHGRLWVASWHGINIARQAFMQPSGVVKEIKVAITGIDASPAYETGLKPLIYKENLTLRKDQRDITFQYVLPNPLDPGAVSYQYMLEGYDSDWITTDQRRVRYPQLPGGSFNFMVRAKERDDQSWTNITSIELSIPKRLIEFWWFWGVISALLLTVIVLINRLLLSKARKAERLKADFEHQVSEIQMQALRAQMNPHFLFNSLNSIKYFAISKSKDETAAYLSKFSMLVRAILNNSKSRTISLKDELDALRLYIEIEHLRLDGKFDYQIDIDTGIHIKQAQIPPMILQPYVENAIWHGLMHKDGRGKLLVQVKDMGHQIQCIIEDNGIGRHKASEFRGKQTDHKNSVGMQITSDRIALINKIYHVDTQVHVIDLADESGKPTGTRVVINIPLIHDEEE
jgi:ligand-binding sensor domain-containing protein